MIHRWSVTLPISDNPGWDYNGIIYEFSDGIAFFYKELTVGLIAVRISQDGQLVQTNEYQSVKTTIPAWWLISPADPKLLVCGEDLAFRMDTLTILDDPPEDLLRQFQDKRQQHHFEDDPFDFDHYRIEHTTSFGYRCRDIRDQKILWKLSLNGYLYHDMIRVPGTNLILICTAGHGGSVYAIDLPTGEIRYEVKTGGTRHIALFETCFYCYKIGKTGELLKVDLQTGTVLDSTPLAFTDIDCPLYRTSTGEIIAFSRIKVSKTEWQPLLSCFTDDGEIRVCDECGSRFLASSSRMQNLCPECASVLYGYENCNHVFQNGRCTRCLWDGSRSDYIQSSINKALPKTILDYAEGRLSHEEFETELYLHPELWEELQSLMPADIADPDCRFRTLFPNMKLLETNQYRVKQTLLAFDYSGFLAHALVGALVCYHDPSAEIRKPLEESELSFLEKNNLDFIGGPEADQYVRELLLSRADSTAAEKKSAIRKAFHIQPRKRPGWVQEPEWPFRNGKPLRFLSQRRDGDRFEYVFDDPETGEQTTITQLA